MKGYVRSLLYWGYEMEKFFLSILAGMVAMWAVLGIMEGDLRAEMLPTYLPMMGIIMLLIQGGVMVSYNLPQAVSYGGTRKEVMVGMEIIMHIILLQIMLLMLFFTNYFKEQYMVDTKMVILIFCAMLLLACGSANCIFATTIRFGKIIGICLYVVFILAIIIVFLVLMLAGELEPIGDFLAIWNGGGIVVIAALVDVIMMCFAFLEVRKYEVKI